jgi:hypothetical protein
MIGSYQAFNNDSIDSSQVYLGYNNKSLLKRINENYDLKWDLESLKSSFKSLCKSLVHIHREVCVMDDVSFILELINEVFEKLKFECLRIGAISKTLPLPKISASSISMKFSLQQCALGIKSIETLYNSLILFLEKYSKEDFDLLNFLNMNRIGKAERLLNGVVEKIQKLEKFSYLLRFHSLGLLTVCAVRWIKKMRINLPKRANQTLEFDDDEIRNAMPKTNYDELKINTELEQSGPDPLFTGGNEGKDGMWPASPIDKSFTLDVSLNSTITQFVSNIPKTRFTPNFSVRKK